MSKSRAALLLLAGVVLMAMWWAQSGAGGGGGEQRRTSSSTSAGVGAEGSDPTSGLSWISPGDLPPEARDTLALIDSGGPFPYDEDGIVFLNRERVLPAQDYGYYHEYTVVTPGADTRGARRIVTGATDEFYWTDDHYQSFERIKR